MVPAEYFSNLPFPAPNALPYAPLHQALARSACNARVKQLLTPVTLPIEIQLGPRACHSVDVFHTSNVCRTAKDKVLVQHHRLLLPRPPRSVALRLHHGQERVLLCSTLRYQNSESCNLQLKLKR